MFDLDEMIERLKEVKNQPIGTSAGLTVEEINYICQTVQTIFMNQPNLLEINLPITIVGDIHGQFHDLLRIFESYQYPPQTQYLFLGNYIDDGNNSIECLCLLLLYKIKYPNSFFMLRGSHECSYVNRLHGFFDECIRNYSIDIWRSFSDVFNLLPVAAIVGEKIFCVHGGLSPNLQNLDQIRDMQRPLEVPEEGLLRDLLCANPRPDIDDWEEEDDETGISYCFGYSQVESFLQTFNFDLICRGHQETMDGFEYAFPDSMSIVTIFSAPNYCYQYRNKGAVLSIYDSLLCSFSFIEPQEYLETNNTGIVPHSLHDNNEMELELL